MNRAASSSPVRRAGSAWRPRPTSTGWGWRVVGAMRSPDAGLERLRQATGAALRRSTPDRRPTRPRGSGVDRRCRQGHRGGGRSARRARAQCRDRRRGLRRGDAVRRVGAGVPHEPVRTRAAHQRAACQRCGPPGAGGSSSCRARVASAACRRSAPTRRPRPPSNAGPNPWRTRSRRSASASRILVSGTFETEIITEQTPPLRGPERAVCQTICGDRSQGSLHGGPPGEPAGAFRFGAREGPRRSAVRSPGARSASTPACCCSAAACCRADSSITRSAWRWLSRVMAA